MPLPLPILLAEDEESDVFFLRYALEEVRSPHGLMVARDGKEAVDYLSGQGPYADRARYPLPALLLLDLKMPRLNGFDVLVWLQSRPDLNAFPTVVLTSSPNEADQQRAQQLGAADYVVKPHSLKDLVQVVQQLHAKWLNGKA